MGLITQRATLFPGVVGNVLESEIKTLTGLLREGCPMHTGIVIYAYSEYLDGVFEVRVKVGACVTAALNTKCALSVIIETLTDVIQKHCTCHYPKRA